MEIQEKLYEVQLMITLSTIYEEYIYNSPSHDPVNYSTIMLFSRSKFSKGQAH